MGKEIGGANRETQAHSAEGEGIIYMFWEWKRGDSNIGRREKGTN